ncbi:filamentous hemagglutinin N-terminal domain-containing protein, partial [Pantanalinema sp. GBBB05]|uniref:two-partner secretion domain-containing protein n=1 Tax=Pantanalinema sp. GBBB05 TaxID=2604139 RepID=UPI003D813F26
MNGRFRRSRFSQPFGLVAFILTLHPLGTQSLAQLVPDSTLGNHSSSVNTNGTTDTIQGGMRIGDNLFHSFREFNVATGRSLYFNAPGVSNILTRVTGANSSHINGRLGVLGSANLFLLNPNGILFGPNASLDIRGSFTASTAGAIAFADGSEFSATNPTSPDLLTVSVPLGLQRGPNQSTATIANQGNLNVGQDLTLDSNRLELRGQLQAGRDLTLRATDTLQVRDSETQALRAIAGNNLILQGNTSIDILALSHPDTQIQSGNNLTLISDGTISGDAHFTSGGNLSFLTTTGAPGEFVSEFDPIIRANGNVTFGNYTGAALKVEAAGSIQGGNIRITRPDTAVPTTDPDYTTLTTLPSVILRAGLPTVAGTNTPQTTSGTIFTSTPSLVGNITVGEIDTSSTTDHGGAITLVSQNGNIHTANLSATAIAPNSAARRGGDVTLTAINGDINVRSTATATPAVIDTRVTGIGSLAAASDGGSVRLTATGDIWVSGGEIRAESRVNRNSGGTGGTITIASSNGNIRTDIIRSSIFSSGISYDRLASGVVSGSHGGNVTLTAPHGSIETDAIFTRASNTAGRGGDLSLSARGDIRTGSLRTQGFGLGSPTAAGGNISVVSTEGSLQTGHLDATAVADRVRPGDVYPIPFTYLTGLGGSVSLAAPGAISFEEGIFTSGGTGAGDITIISQTGFVADRVLISSDSFGSGVGGNITITAPSITLLNSAQITASAHVNGQGGAVLLRAPEFVSIRGSSLEPAVSTVTVIAPVVIAGFTPDLNTGSFAPAGVTSPFVFALFNSTTISDLQPDLPSGTIYPSGVFTQATDRATGNAGKVEIQTGQLIVQDGGTIATTTFGRGNAGSLSLQADNVALRNGNIFAGVAAGASGSGGRIDLQTRTLTVSDGGLIQTQTLGRGTAGTIDITASDAITLSGSSSKIRSGSGDSSRREGDIGAGGNLQLATPWLNIREHATISTETYTRSNAGNVAIASNNLNLTQGGQIRAGTLGAGRAGEIQVQADAVNISGPFSGMISGSGTPEQRLGITGDGGNVRLSTDVLRITNDGIISTSTFTAGQGGSIDVTARDVDLTSAGRLSATTQGQGDAGSIRVQASDRVLINGGRSGLFASTTPQSAGDGGSVFVTTNYLAIQNQGRITVDSEGRGRGGDIQVTANRLDLRDRSVIFAETASSDGGNIRLDVRDLLLLRHNSHISASAGNTQAGGNGGNIQIRARFVIGVLDENSDITANAFTGHGGQVNITAYGIFGLRFQPRLTPFSDITASSQFGFNGTVTL